MPRIKCESLPFKFGADLDKSCELIAMAVKLQIDLIILNFIGAFQTLDLFDEMVGEINIALNQYFPPLDFDKINKNSKSFKIIAELGTFLTTSAYSLCVNVLSKKIINQDIEKYENDNHSQSKYITENLNSFATNDSEKNFNVDFSKKILYCINDSVHASFKW